MAPGPSGGSACTRATVRPPYAAPPAWLSATNTVPSGPTATPRGFEKPSATVSGAPSTPSARNGKPDHRSLGVRRDVEVGIGRRRSWSASVPPRRGGRRRHRPHPGPAGWAVRAVRPAAGRPAACRRRGPARPLHPRVQRAEERIGAGVQRLDAVDRRRHASRHRRRLEPRRGDEVLDDVVRHAERVGVDEVERVALLDHHHHGSESPGRRVGDDVLLGCGRGCGRRAHPPRSA